MRRSPVGMNGSAGLTLIELIITVALLSVLASIATPYFRDLMLANKLTTQTNEIVLATHAARVEAIKRTQQVRISALDASSASNEWGPGLVVYVDNDASGTFNAGDEQIRIVSAAPGKQTIDEPAGVANFDFLPSGGISVGSITFRVCDGRVAETGRAITVRNTGQVSASDYTGCT